MATDAPPLQARPTAGATNNLLPRHKYNSTHHKHMRMQTPSHLAWLVLPHINLLQVQSISIGVLVHLDDLAHPDVQHVDAHLWVVKHVMGTQIESERNTLAIQTREVMHQQLTSDSQLQLQQAPTFDCSDAVV